MGSLLIKKIWLELFASQAIALANRSHDPNQSDVANSMRIPTNER
jgi:hypothetical protein